LKGSQLPVQIVEILGPSAQGQARPYKCRGEDGHIYFVKGRQTTRACLWHEWISGHLARRFGLQVPPFEIVDICQELLDESPQDWRDLGVGQAFGSRLHPSAVWMEVSSLPMVPPVVQRDVLVFDWWVRNNDRQMGNTNLLWDVSANALVVIDHNQAFDRHFSMANFITDHVFAAHWQAVSTDLVLQAEYAQRLSDALQGLEVDCDNVPADWHWANIEMDVPANFDLNRIKATLARCTTPELWRTV
jgi:hypothetical protein